MLRVRSVVVAAATVAMTASVAAPAGADAAKFKDKHGDLEGGMDIHAARVDNNGRWISVTSTHRNLRSGPKAPNGSVSVYIDTVRRRKGPEFAMSGPVGFDGDFAIMRMRRWKQVGDPLGCRLRFHVNEGRDRVRFAVPRRCLDRAYDHRVGRIRVSIRAWQDRRHGQPRSDWAPKRRHFYRAVAAN